MAEITGFRVYTLQLNAQLRLGFPAAPYTVNLATEYKSLTHYTQKVRSHTRRCSHCLYVHGFRFFSLPSPGFFSPFPHGTGSLSVSQGVFSLGGWSPYSDRIPRVPPYSSSSQPVHFGVRDYHPVPSDFPDRSTNTQADSDSGCSPFARRYWGISVDFFSSGYLDVSVPRFASLTYVFS